jgi:hypothetical protein
MRCPYCREEIHDEALKCPHCSRLLVPKPGWQRKGQQVGGVAAPAPAATATTEEPARTWVPSEGPATVAADGRRERKSRRGPVVLLVLLLMVGSGALGFLVGRATTEGSVGFVRGDAETVAELEALAEERLEEIERLEVRLAEAAPTPGEQELRAALVACEQAIGIVIQREAALFSDQPALAELVRIANRCLAPIGRQIEIPTT